MLGSTLGLLLTLSSAHAATVVATLKPGVTSAIVLAAPAPIEVATFVVSGATWTLRCKAKGTGASCTADTSGKVATVTAMTPAASSTTMRFGGAELQSVELKLDSIVLRMDSETTDE